MSAWCLGSSVSYFLQVCNVPSLTAAARSTWEGVKGWIASLFTVLIGIQIRIPVPVPVFLL
uniref:Uncharacterized protein n=1 Tax=Talaromyces marneffei PM1 TaxID=1077442 RepID=A0A093Y0T4_TALMA